MAYAFASLSRPSLKLLSSKPASEAVHRDPSTQSDDTHALSSPACPYAGISIWPPERKATPQPGSSGNAAPQIVRQVLQNSGQPLDTDVPADLGARADFDFSRVRIHTDPRSAQSARAVDAAAYTVGHHVVFDSGEFEPRSPSGRNLLHHEMMHVVQQRSALPDRVLALGDIHSPLEYDANRSAPSLILQRQPKQEPKKKQEAPPPTSLLDYPEAERQKITVFDALPTDIADRVADAFSPDAARYTGETDTQTVFSGNIEEKYHGPLDSLSNWLLGEAPKHLQVNQTTTFPVAPMKRLVRMTLLQHGKQKKVLLIEGLGPIQVIETKTGEANFKTRKCKWGSGWKDGEKQLLFQALTLMPALALNEGLKFNRADAPEEKDKDKKKKAPKKEETAEKKDDSGEAALFDPNTNTVTVFNKAFTDQTPSRVRGALTHELGHAYDFRPIVEANAKFEASAKDAAAEQVMKQAHALSGGDMDPDDYSVEFRKAGKKDGISADKSKTPRVNSLGVKMTLKGSETDYGNTNWKELFAESFMLFTTDPGLLQAIRPNIHAYFVKEFPPSAPASAPSPASTPPPATHTAPAAAKH
jgi:hypothetical protein